MIQEATKGNVSTIEDVCMDVQLLLDDKLGWVMMGKSITGEFDYFVAAGRDSVAGIGMAASLSETGFEACSGDLFITVENIYVDDRRRKGSHPCPDWFISTKWSPNPFEVDCAVG